MAYWLFLVLIILLLNVQSPNQNYKILCNSNSIILLLTYCMIFKLHEVKLVENDQLFMSLEGKTICEPNIKHVTDIQFICNKSITDHKIIYIPNTNNRCKHVIELTSVVVCSIDDFDIRKICSNISIPHNQYKLNLNPLRRWAGNYLVRNQNRQFEMNICGRLTNNNKCGGNITTICDITDVANSTIYAVGIMKNNKEIIMYDESRNLKLIQREKSKKGRRVEIIFKCDENIPPEKTKPEFLSEHKNMNVAYFEVATSTVCIPRMPLCEIFKDNRWFNLKPLYKRIENWIVPNEKVGGYFYLNICGYLNEHSERIPTSCRGNKTSACYVDSSGKGISIGSTQIGPYYINNSILLKYTDGMFCKNSLNWTTTINLICSDKTQLMHDETNSTSCIHTFKWKSPEACETLFRRNDNCAVKHPRGYTEYNLSSLRSQKFEVNDYEDIAKFQFSICGPLPTTCNGYLNSAVCWLINGVEKNIGIFTEQVVFDNGKIYMSMVGEKCIENGPPSLTTIQFVCDYLDSKYIDFNKDLNLCTFDFIIYTKQACTNAKTINCTRIVDNELENVYNLNTLTLLNRNYEIFISQKKKIVLNVCHSVINNNINGINCQPNSGVCLVDSNNIEISSQYKNLGDVEKIPRIKGNKIILEMENGFYDSYNASSVIEFKCSIENIGPKLISQENHKYVFQWFTPLVCPNLTNKHNQMIITKSDTIAPIFNVTINKVNYSIHICPNNDIDINYCDLVETHSNDITEPGRIVILNINEQKIKRTMTQKSNQVFYNTNKTCNEIRNETEKIIFTFVCGLELQKPTIEKKMCIYYVFNVNPKICEKKLTCSAGLYNLILLKGSYVVKYEDKTFCINMCMPGKNGVSGLMEFDGKNYSMGYQMTSPKTEVSNMAEIHFKNGDYSLGNSSIKMKYSTIIRLQCDTSIVKGNPIFIKSNDNSRLEFVWNTSLVCQKKLVEFQNSTCTATVKYYSKDYVNSQQISLNHILNNNSEFVDHLTNTVFNINFCNTSVCINGSKCIENMSLQYDIYNKQLIANFKNANKNMNFTNVDIIITCSDSNHNDILTPRIKIVDDEIIINTHSEAICCLDNVDQINEEMCKNYIFAPVTIAQFETTNVINDKLQTDLEDYKPVKYVSFGLNETNKKNYSEKQNTINKKQIKESNLYIEDSNKNSFENHYGKTNIFIPENQLTDTSFHISGTIIVMALLMIISLVWFYRYQLRYKIRKLLNSLLFNRRRERRSNQNLIEIN